MSTFTTEIHASEITPGITVQSGLGDGCETASRITVTSVEKFDIDGTDFYTIVGTTIGHIRWGKFTPMNTTGTFTNMTGRYYI